MSKPGWTQGGAPDAGKPQIYDKAPPQWTGVPVERDPVSGKLFSGDPLGRGDKSRSARSPGKTALITGAAAVVVAAVALTVFLVTRPDDDPDPAAAAGGVQASEQTTTSAAPTTTTPAAETGPRTVPLNFTTTAVTPPPGFGPDPTQGSVGDVLTFSWTLTGPCDGAGSCEIEHCDASECGNPIQGEAQGAGYVARFDSSVSWDAPQCPTTGTLDNMVTWAVTGQGDDATVTGSWVQQATQVVYAGTDGSECGVYLTEWSIASQ